MDYPTSIKAVVLHQGRVLLLANERGEWDLPGGRPDPGEDHRATLVREVREEISLSHGNGARARVPVVRVVAEIHDPEGRTLVSLERIVPTAAAEGAP